MRIAILCGIMMLLFSTLAPAQVQVAGWHVYPGLKKCPEFMQPNSTFTVSVALPTIWTAEQVAGINFEWKVSAGTITDGQGTKEITVHSGSGGYSLTTEVLMKSPLFPHVSENCSVNIEKQPEAVLYDESRFVTQGYLKKMLDGFYTVLNNEPAAQGYFVIYPESNLHHRQIERIIRNWMRVRNFDAARLTFARGEVSSRSVTQAWIVPPGVLLPEFGVRNTETSTKP